MNFNMRIEKAKCPKCTSKKIWTNRGKIAPQYRFKCTKCGFKR